ncbi:Wzz/FepE/Etk N-terminal domain-containing protein [uncultured Aliivibrio sp.]|uniref:Wzz/FepE/Etk N-terminal domain-containing protein n=1 Tax=uncultured Aliivibrio sp. TaxID=873085 RepID=UPI002601CCA5|nr:Wzz/FepE/Etk N-terminal domain-containing protein [uncultured Aliivibrio sp.]
MNNQSPQQFQQYPQPPSFQNDEIDLKELFLALWAGKLWIIGLTLLFAAGATVFALSQPNVYESKAVLVVDADPYSVGLDIGPKENEALMAISGKPVKERIQKATDVSLDQLNLLSISGNVTISQQGQDPDFIFNNVQVFTQHINKALVQIELEKAELALLPLKDLIKTTDSIAVKGVLAEKYAQQVYKIALLKSPNTDLIHVIQEPVKATSHIKPKRALIIVLGTLLGGMLGVALVLIRFAFRKEESELETEN